MKRRNFSVMEMVFFCVAMALIVIFSRTFWASNQNETKALEQNSLAQLMAYEGQLHKRRAGSFVWSPVKEGENFYLGDAIRTQTESSAQLMTAEGRSFRLEAESMMVFRKSSQATEPELVYGPEARSLSPEIRIQKNRPARQELWWLAPQKEQVFLGEKENEINLTWGALQADDFEVEVYSDKRKLLAKKTGKTSITIKVENEHTLKAFVRSGRSSEAKIERTFKVIKLLSPTWSRLDWQGMKITGAWVPTGADRYEVELISQSGDRQVIRSDNPYFEWGSPQASLSPPVVAQIKALYDEQVVAGATKLLFPVANKNLSLSLSTGRVLLKADKEGQIKCQNKLILSGSNQAPVFKNTEYWLETRKDNDSSRIEKTVLGKSSFCPPTPGHYQLKLLEKTSAGIVVGESEVQRLQTDYLSADPVVIYERAPARSGVEEIEKADLELSIKPLDRGPIYMSTWAKSLWAELEWESLSKALLYELEVSSKGLFEGEEKRFRLRSNRHFLNINTKKHFFWRVRALAKQGQVGPWSQPLPVRFQTINTEQPWASQSSVAPPFDKPNLVQDSSTLGIPLKPN